MSNQDLELATHFVSAPNEFLSSIKKNLFFYFSIWRVSALDHLLDHKEMPPN